MSDSFFKINKGLTLAPQSGAPANPVNGDMYYDDLTSRLMAYVNGVWINIGQVATAVPTGSVMPYTFSTAPVGYVLASGATVGNAASGATNRANADTEELFTGLWNSIPNARLPIQNSFGVNTTRGIDAATDFASNKRLPVPDLRGRALIGMDIPTGAGPTYANAITIYNAQLLGNTGGVQTVALSTAEMPAHQHRETLIAASSLKGNIFSYWPTDNGGSTSAGSGIAAGGGSNPTVNSYTRTATAGGSSGVTSAHNNVQPFTVVNYIIKL